MLDFISTKTGDNPQLLIIWLHGLGADGHDFEPVVPQFKNTEKDLHFIFPHAPVQPVTINGGMRMRSWYDIKMMDIGKMPDEEGIRESEQSVLELIEAQIKAGFKAEQIVLAGFFQNIIRISVDKNANFRNLLQTGNIQNRICQSCIKPCRFYKPGRFFVKNQTNQVDPQMSQLLNIFRDPHSTYFHFHALKILRENRIILLAKF